MVKKAGSLLIFVLTMMTVMLIPAKSVLSSYEISDSAGLFYSDELSDIEELASLIDSKYEMNVYVLTDNSRNGQEAVDKIEEAYEDAGYCDNTARGGIGIIIDMANREVNLVTDRDMIYYITDDREERIYDSGYGYLGNGEYGSAMIAMLEATQSFLKSGIPGNQYIYEEETGRIIRYKGITGSDLLIAFLAAAVIAILFCITVSRSYLRIAAYKYDINRHAVMHLTASSDTLINQHVTRRHIHRAPPGGGGGHGGGGGRSTVHRSSSGRSFGGGGGRKF